jgi:DNA-binding LacI/PurR family transcriptional regulator
MAVTLRHVAEKAGCSTATASRILTGTKIEAFPETTRRRVHAAADFLGYRPNLAARSLQTQRSFLIGVLMNAANAGLATEFLRGVQASLNSGDYSPIVLMHADCGEQANCLRRCTDRRVDGLIVNTSHDARGRFDTREFATLIEQGTAVVEVFGRFIAGVPQFNIDNAAVARKSVEHLLKLRHRRIAMLTHEGYVLGKGKQTARHFDAYERYRGYEAAMQAAGLEPLLVAHPISGEVDVQQQFVDGGVTAMDALLAHPAKPTAVVCYNDLEAIGLIRAARLKGIAVPSRLSIVGYGDMEPSRIAMPALTTVPVPAREVGRQAAEALLHAIGGQPAESALIEADLVVRESTVERNI